MSSGIFITPPGLAELCCYWFRHSFLLSVIL